MTRPSIFIEAPLINSEISRRAFIAGASALGLSASLIGEAVAQTPKRGGTLRMAMSSAGTTDSLDPTLIRSNYMLSICGQLYDTLTSFDTRGQVQPSLAESWEPEADLKTWNVKLRRGVLFHNGKEMTADDVVYSINYHRTKESRSAVRVFTTSMVEVQTNGKYGVTIKLENPNVDLPVILTLAQLVVIPQGSTKEGVGTGAFKLASFEPGVLSKTTRNQNDWNPNRGYVEAVETIAINDATTRVNALLSGAVDLANSIGPTSAQFIERNPKLQLFTTPSTTHYTFDMNIQEQPYDSLQLRQALKYAVDREAILKTQLRGYGKIGNDQPISPIDPFFAADIPQRPYDPDKAKFLTKQAGFDQVVTISAADGAFAGAVDVALLIQASAAKAGINVRVNRVPNDGYFDKVYKKQPFFANFFSGRPTPGLMFTHAYRSDAYANSTGWKNPKFDQLLASALAEVDVQKRKQIYHDMQFMLHDEGGSLISFFTNQLDAGQKNVMGFVPSPFYEMSGLRAAEKVWLDT